MNAAQITHIFWKEYRTQRALWLAMVLLFLGTALMTLIFLPKHHRPDVSSLLFSGVVTVAFYMLASTSILYASEKEQKTDVLLRILPTNPWLTLGVKTAWVLLSSLLAVSIFAAAAYLFASPGRGMEDGGLTILLRVFAYMFCCSLVATLLTRHVFSAIGLSVALMLGGLLLATYFESQQWIRHDGRLRYFIILTITLFLTSLELNRRWFRESDWTWGRGFRFGRALTMQAALALPVEAAGSGRVWRRQVWKEWQSARMWLIGISSLILLLTAMFYQDYRPSDDGFALNIMTLILVPLLIGVGTCRADQSSERFLFLGNRGRSAFRLLLTKHAVWLTSGAILVLFLMLLMWPDFSRIPSHRESEFEGSLGLIPISYGLLSSTRIEQLSGSLVPGIQFWGGVALLLYSLGHFFSILIAQPVMSLLVSLFSSIFVTILVCFCYALDVPLFVLTVAPAICLLSLSFYHGEVWLTGNRSLASWKQLGLWSLLSIWTTMMLLAVWRVAEIPWMSVIDLNGLTNISTYYFTGCVAGLLATLVILLAADSFRRNFSDSAGRPIFGTRRWCTLAGAIGTFLVGHNLALMAGMFAYSQHTTMLARPMRLAVDNDLQERSETTDDLYQMAGEQIAGEFPIPAEILNSPQLRQTDLNQRNQFLAYYEWNAWDEVAEEQRSWLEENRNVLPLFFEADRNGVVETTLFRGRPGAASAELLALPLNFLVNTQLRNNLDFILLVRLQALQLEHEGQLAEAWKHHLALVRYARRFADGNFPTVRIQVLRWLDLRMLNGDLWRWSARQEQTPELLAQAARELHAELEQLSPLAEAYEREGGWSLQFLDIVSTIDLIAKEEVLATLPWERQRLRTLTVGTTTLRTQLAGKIDEGMVRRMDPYYFNHLDGQERYWLLHRQQGQTEMGAILTVDRNRGQTELQLASEDFDNSRWRSTETIPLPDAANKAETTPILMSAPANVSALGIIHKPLAEELLQELDFWTTLDTWIGDCAIYGYRAETGAFPAHLGQLHEAESTREIFSPLAQNVVVQRAPLPASMQDSRRMSVNHALLRSSDTFGPAEFDYHWFHAHKWPQPEYNFGETPDRKPTAPLDAPKPEEVQP